MTSQTNVTVLNVCNWQRNALW